MPEVKAEVEVPFISQGTALGESKKGEGEEGFLSSALNPHLLFILGIGRAAQPGRHTSNWNQSLIKG